MKGRKAKKAAKSNENPLATDPKPLVLNELVLKELTAHFSGLTLTQLVTASREFPIAARVDLHTALSYLLSETYPARLLGIHRMHNRGTLTFSDLLSTEHDLVLIAPR